MKKLAFLIMILMATSCGNDVLQDVNPDLQSVEQSVDADGPQVAFFSEVTYTLPDDVNGSEVKFFLVTDAPVAKPRGRGNGPTVSAVCGTVQDAVDLINPKAVAGDWNYTISASNGGGKYGVGFRNLLGNGGYIRLDHLNSKKDWTVHGSTLAEVPLVKGGYEQGWLYFLRTPDKDGNPQAIFIPINSKYDCAPFTFAGKTINLPYDAARHGELNGEFDEFRCGGIVKEYIRVIEEFGGGEFDVPVWNSAEGFWNYLPNLELTVVNLNTGATDNAKFAVYRKPCSTFSQKYGITLLRSHRNDQNNIWKNRQLRPTKVTTPNGSRYFFLQNGTSKRIEIRC